MEFNSFKEKWKGLCNVEHFLLGLRPQMKAKEGDNRKAGKPVDSSYSPKTEVIRDSNPG